MASPLQPSCPQARGGGTLPRAGLDTPGFVAALACALAAPSAGAQTTVPLDLDPQSHLSKKKQEQVCGLPPCGTTTLPGFAAGVLDPSSPSRTRRRRVAASPPRRSCGSQLLSTGDQLFVDVDGEVCYPGNSNIAPGAAKSFGSPLRATGTVHDLGWVRRAHPGDRDADAALTLTPTAETPAVVEHGRRRLEVPVACSGSDRVAARWTVGQDASGGLPLRWKWSGWLTCSERAVRSPAS
jgi:hypothetical protein